MNKKKKVIGNSVFLFLVFGLTLYGVFHGEDFGEIYQTICQTDKRYLVAAIICVVFFIGGESIIIHYLMKTLKIALKEWKCFLISSVGFFFSCITPSASGGQPMQMVFMKKEKIPLPVSTVVLMIVTITYKMVLVFMGLFLMIFQRGFIRKYLTGILPVFYLGIFLNVVCVGFMLLLVFHPKLMRKMMHKGYAFLVKIHIIRKNSNWMEKLENSMDVYHETADYLKEHFPVMVYIFLLTFLQRIILFAVTYFVYRAFGLGGISMYDLIMLQSAIAIAVDMLPLPGGMGISEKLFSIIFLPIFGSALILPGMILSRGLSYYTELIISALMTVVATFVLGRKKPEKVNCR